MNCLKCKKEILITKIDEAGFGWLLLGESKKLKYDGENEYVKCPYCKAKNIYSQIKPVKGALTYSFTEYIEHS